MILKKLYHGFVVFVGFILSPLSWWNDLIVNFPLSYLIALPFGLISGKVFILAFIVAYWLTNIIGFIMMHNGLKNLLNKEIHKKKFKKELLNMIFISLVYSLLILILIYYDILKFPEEFMARLVK